MTPQPSEGSPPVLALEEVTKRFPGVLANDRISLSLHEGEVHALLGENGAGKSTLISQLAGMQQPDAGRILVQGREIRIASPRQALALGIGTVFQHSTLVPSLSVLENLMLGHSWRRRLDLQAARARLDAISERLAITLPAQAPLRSLSLGEQQLVEIVRALWLGQRLLILDEATSLLSIQGVEKLRGVVSRLKEEGTAVLFITHKLPEALNFGDRLSVLRSGRLVGSLSVTELRSFGEKEAIERVVALMFGTERSPLAAPASGQGRPTGPALLQVKKLHVATGPLEPRVEDISFTLHAGEIFGIAGVEGNGQKQLAEALAGQRGVLGGSIELDDGPVQQLTVPARQKRGVRYLTDDRLGEATVGRLSIALNLLLKRIGDRPFWQRGFERPQTIDAHARKLIARHDVRTPGPSTAIARLSGGNIQKVILARELDGRPKVVIYNKPTHGLDLRNAEFARAAIEAQAAQGTGSVVISTDLDELLALCDRIAVMSAGRIVGIVRKGKEARERIGELMIRQGPRL